MINLVTSLFGSFTSACFLSSQATRLSERGTNYRTSREHLGTRVHEENSLARLASQACIVLFYRSIVALQKTKTRRHPIDHPVNVLVFLVVLYIYR